VGTDFEGGIYHGRILLPAEYPFKPPNIVFLTKNGRFETGTKICLSISAYHPEHWQPAWGVRTMLEAIISFLPTEGQGAIGALDWTPRERKKLAEASLSFCCPICGEVKALLSDPAADGDADPEMAAQIAQLHVHGLPTTPGKPEAGKHEGKADASPGEGASSNGVAAAEVQGKEDGKAGSEPAVGSPSAVAAGVGAAATATTTAVATAAGTAASVAVAAAPVAAAAAAPVAVAAAAAPVAAAAAAAPVVNRPVVAGREQAQVQRQNINRDDFIDQLLVFILVFLAVIIAVIAVYKTSYMFGATKGGGEL
jgi:ubiquitin-conjugating enzyme E2 J1